MNMASPIHDDEDEQEKPLDPAVENVRRKLIRFMLVNLAVLAVALIAVVGAIVYKSRNSPPAVAQPSLSVPSDGMVEGEIALPPGARLVSQSISGDRLVLEVEEFGGTPALYVYDIAAGRMVGRFVISNETR